MLALLSCIVVVVRESEGRQSSSVGICHNAQPQAHLARVRFLATPELFSFLTDEGDALGVLFYIYRKFQPNFLKTFNNRAQNDFDLCDPSRDQRSELAAPGVTGVAGVAGVAGAAGAAARHRGARRVGVRGG